MSKNSINKKIPITAITGFLGSGKTTLLNHILSSSKGVNYGVVVNDFGELNIDSELIAQKTDKKLELSNGCICCNLKTLDLNQAISQFVYEGSNIDHILIEASGLAEPRDLALTLKNTLSQDVAFQSIVTLIDGSNISQNAQNSAHSTDQILFSDFIIVNKIDLISKTRASQIRKLIASINPKARIIETSHGQLQAELLFDTIADSNIHSNPKLTSSHVHTHEKYNSFSFSTQKSLDPMKFQEFVNTKLPTTVYRAKGIINFGKKGAHRKYIFQQVGVRSELTWQNWHGPASTKLVFIDTFKDSKQLQAALRACIDSSPQEPLPDGIQLVLPKKA